MQRSSQNLTVIYILCLCTKCVWFNCYRHQLSHRILFPSSTTWTKLCLKKDLQKWLFGANMVTSYFVFRSCWRMNDFCSLENSTHGVTAWQSPMQQRLFSSEHLLEHQWQFSHQCFVSKETQTKFLTHLKIFLPSWEVGQNSLFIRKCNYFLKKSHLKERGLFCYIKGYELSGLEESSHCEVLENNKDPSLLMRFGVVLMKVKDRLIQNLL